MKKHIFFAFILTFFAIPCIAQKENTPSPEAGEGYNFTPVVTIKTTPVKDQAGTGTCWCFATTSFIESELLRMGKGEYDLSEMYIVRFNYFDRLKDNFIQQGKGNLGQGSVGHDWMSEFAENGIVPDEVYTGLNYSMKNHYHGELNAFINAVAAVPLKRNKESDQYLTIVNAILDTYLGRVPQNFTFKGVGYSPDSFSGSLGINPNEYIEITSFMKFPFYKPAMLSIPDNWRKMYYYNVPLDELVEIMDSALIKGYTVAWDGDVSEKGFSHLKGVAILPELDNTSPFRSDDKTPYSKMTKEELSAEVYKFIRPFPEANVTQASREEGFNNKSTTDDHLMHITGIVKDQYGTKYYHTKNSWGTDNNPFGGYLNISENYVRAKTIAIMVHKNAVPAAIKAKLGL